MGVKGLWQLLLPIGRRISIETLEGKILAVDASIWLTQFLKAMRDPDTGKVQPAAHLVGVLRRLCRLRFHGIRPVLVFDGATPEIKKRETARRRARREQFAKLDQAGVQKLARRLLAQTLQQQQKSIRKEGGTNAKTTVVPAMAPGFDPGGQQAGIATLEDDRKPPAREETQDSSGDIDNPTENDEAIALALAKEEYGDRSKDEPEKVSDWDLPLTEPNDGDAQSKTGNSSSNDDDDVEYEDFSAFSKRDQPGAITSVDQIASLSPRKRKDAIEQMKRDQRRKSRKEFMPAAADPAAFSSVQVTNFLRSTHLNQSIHKMAVREVEERERREGPAQNGLSRVVLIRENENTEQELTATNSKNGRSSSKGRGKQRFVSFRGSGDSSSDDGGAPLSQAWYTGSRNSVNSHLKATADMCSSGDDEESEGSNSSEDETPDSRQSASETVENQVRKGPATLLPPKDPKGARALPQGPNRILSVPPPRNRDGNDFFVDGSDDEENTSELNPLLEKRAKCEISPDPNTTTITEQSQAVKSSSACETNVASVASSGDEASIDWEDGDDEVCSNSQTEPQLKTLSTKQAKQNVKTKAWDTKPAQRGINLDSGEECSSTPEMEAVAIPQSLQSSSFDQHTTARENPSPTAPQKDVVFSAETAAVLARAEGTAANLANWAGRAFRRAMKEVGGDLPDKRGREQGNTTAETKVSDQYDETPAARETKPSRSYESATEGSAKNEPLASPYFKREEVSPKIPPQPSEPIDHTAISKETEGMIKQFNEEWKNERNQRERDMETITDEMKLEVLQLLQLFGVPYVEAPAEAEAQCAALEQLGLVDGIVTEDSDVFVFGGQTVYKNIFADKMYAEAYVAKDAEREMQLNRNAMVALAMLLGSDYTEGVKGVGIVNAMEVLRAFDVREDLEGGLGLFRNWLNGFDPFDDPVSENDAEVGHAARVCAFHKKHRAARTRWVVPDSFPAENVIHAFKVPVVDKSTQRFSWGVPDVDNLTAFCSRYLGWTVEETNRIVDPVVKRITTKGYRQTRIDSFMSYEDSIKFANIRSKRLREVIGSIDKDETKKMRSEK